MRRKGISVQKSPARRSGVLVLMRQIASYEAIDSDS